VFLYALLERGNSIVVVVGSQREREGGREGERGEGNISILIVLTFFNNLIFMYPLFLPISTRRQGCH